MVARRKEEPSWGEVADYHGCVDNVRKACGNIIKTTRYYQNEAGELISDGYVYTAEVREEIKKIQANLMRIDRYCRKYGKL